MKQYEARSETANSSSLPAYEPGISDTSAPSDFGHEGPPPPKKTPSRKIVGAAVGLIAVLFGVVTATLVGVSADDANSGNTDSSGGVAFADSEEPADSPRVEGDGSRDAPFGTAELTTVEIEERFDDGAAVLWNIEVGELRDITEEVLAFDSNNEAAAGGIRYAGFDVDATLVSTERAPRVAVSDFRWQIFDSRTRETFERNTLATPNLGCGRIENEFDGGTSVFEGGTVSGTVCIPIFGSMFDRSDTLIEMDMNPNFPVYFSPLGASPEPIELAASDGALASTERLGTREAPFAYGAPIDVDVFSVVGDLEEIWNVEVGTLRDETERAIAESDFVDRQEGIVYSMFDLSLTLTGGEPGLESAAASPKLDFGVAGGATNVVYDEGGGGCFLPSEIEPADLVPLGGMLAGELCIAIPAEDFEHPDTRVIITVRNTEFLHFGN